jgi:hypothetical protein
MRQQAVGGQQQAAPKKQGLLGKIGSGIKRVAGGVADAATGNRFDFDKRGGQRPAPQAAGSRNVRGSGARNNRQMQQQRPAAQAAAGGAGQSGGQTAGQAATRPVNNQQQQQRRPISPQMQKRLAATRVGDNAAAAVNKIKPQPGQTVTTQQTPRGTTATLTSSAGSLQKNKQKANRVANAMNKQGANVSVGKIDDF